MSRNVNGPKHLTAVRAAQNGVKRLPATEMNGGVRGRAGPGAPPITPSHCDHQTAEEVLTGIRQVVAGRGRFTSEQTSVSQLGNAGRKSRSGYFEARLKVSEAAHVVQDCLAHY